MRFASVPFAALALVLAAACAGSGPAGEEGAPSPIRYRVAVQASLPGMWHLSPLSYRGGFQPKTLLYETLVRRDARGRIVPGLASAWRFEEGGRVVVLTLREGARFHDGMPVDAEAVRMHFKRWVGLPEHGWLGANERIVDVVADSARELRIVLDEPYALLPDLCAINPCAIRGPGALDSTGEFAGPVGSGPFRFLGALESGETFRLERTAAEGGPTPTGFFLDLVAFQTGGERTSFAALRDGDVDVVVDGWYEHVPRTEVAAVVEDRDLDLFEGAGSRVVYLSFRLEGPTADPLLRRRIAAAVDREALIDAVELGHADPCFAWAAPTVAFWPPGAPASTLPPPAGDAGPAPRLVLLARTDVRREEARATLLAAQLRRAGNEIELRVLPPEEYGEAVLEGAFDLRLEATWGVPFDPYVSLRARFLPPPADPSAARNRFFGVDPRVTALVREASRRPDLDGRVEVYHRIQSLLDREALIVPLLVPRRIGVSRSDVPGWRIRLDHDLYRTRFEALFTGEEGARAEGAATRPEG